MGYNSHYEITFEGTSEQALVAALIGAPSKEFAHVATTATACPHCKQAIVVTGATLDSLLEEEMKWYDYKSDMLAVSAALSGAVLTVTREGEEQGDVERTVYRDGKETESKKAKLTFE